MLYLYYLGGIEELYCFIFVERGKYFFFQRVLKYVYALYDNIVVNDRFVYTIVVL